MPNAAATAYGITFLLFIVVIFEAVLDHQKVGLPILISIPNGSFYYQPAGNFRQGNRVVNAPVELREISGALEIMKYQVSVRDYTICVNAGFCNKVATSHDYNLPQTGVSYLDAVAYAQWFSNLTGDIWRLPKDEEWVWAASERFSGENKLITSDDPSKRWLAEYEQQYGAQIGVPTELRSLGGYGENSRGLADLAGAVWEWTQSCMLSGELAIGDLKLAKRSEYCGVRIVEGRHRALIIDFVRNPKIGGCGAGFPPNYIGFRLVREKVGY